MTEKNSYFTTHQARRELLKTVLSISPGEHHHLTVKDNSIFITNAQTGETCAQFFRGTLNGYHEDEKILEK